MKFFRLILFALAMVAGFGCEEGSAPNDPPTSLFDLSGRVIFSVVGAGLELPDGVYAIDLDGAAGTLRLLSLNASDVRASLDGTTVVYTKISPLHSQDIYSLSLSGGTETDITNRSQVSEYYPDISASGSLAVFSAFYALKGPTAICRMAITGANLVTITDTLDQYSRAWFPRFSPDASAIAFIRKTSVGDSYALAVAAVDGSGQKDLALSGNAYPPRWSLDGRFICHGMPAGSAAGLSVVDVQTGTIRGIVTGSVLLDANGCAWSQDGDLYSFGKLPEDSLFDIYRAARPLFHMPDQIPAGFRRSSTLLGSPDGTAIGILGRRGNEGLSLYVMKSDGTVLTKIMQVSSSGDVQDGGFAQWVR